MAKSAKKFYLTDDSFKGLKVLFTGEYGPERWLALVEQAAPQLEAQWAAYKSAPKGEYLHLRESILPRVVMYQTLCQTLDPEKAMHLMEETVRIEGTEAGELLRRFTNLPLMAPAFLKLFALMVAKLFGEGNGFRQVVHVKTSRELRFDITECPYCKYTWQMGAGELTHIFCDSDIYCYGGMDKITFERTQTLGRGGTCCDFCLKRK